MPEFRPINDIRFDGGRLCLDFINTVHCRPTCDGDEYLNSYRDFLGWLVRKEWLTPGVARRVANQAGDRADSLLGDIRALRELLYRLFEPVARGGSPTASAKDRRWFEALVQAARSRQYLEWSDDGVRWRFSNLDAPGPKLADPILIDAVDLFVAGPLERVKQCDPSEGCGWMFFDTTKNRTRRWCSMEVCGNAAKARAWYRRQYKY